MDGFDSDSRNSRHGLTPWHGTTIIGVKKNGRTVIAGERGVNQPV